MSEDLVRLLRTTAERVFSSADPTAEIGRAGLDDLAGAPLAAVAGVVEVAAYHGAGDGYPERVLADRRLLNCVRMAGALARVRDLTVRHTAERRQFGQPLNRFQAVQQQLATLAAEVALVQAVVEGAVAAGASAERTAAALAVAGAAVGPVTQIAHQLHGAIGMTQEHELHRFTTALWRWRDDDGTEAAAEREVGDRVLAAGADRLWPDLTAQLTSEAPGAGDQTPQVRAASRARRKPR